MKFTLLLLISYLATISCKPTHSRNVEGNKKYTLTTFALDGNQEISAGINEISFEKIVSNDTIFKVSTLIKNNSSLPIYICQYIYYSDEYNNTKGVLYYFDIEYVNCVVKLSPHKTIVLDNYFSPGKTQQYEFDYQIMTDSIYKALSTINEKKMPNLSNITSFKAQGNEYIRFSLDEYPYELFPTLIIETSGVRINIPKPKKD
jgi:hypothetical protein